MNVLVVDPGKNDREVAARFLGGAGHNVTMAADLKAAQANIEQELPALIVLDPSSSVGLALSFLKTIRQNSAKHPWVLILSPKLALTDLTALLQAGADDFMRKPYERDDLVLRASAPERIGKWAAALFGGVREPSASAEEVPAHPFTPLAAWAKVEAACAKDVGQLLTTPFAAVEAPDAVAGFDYGAELILTYAHAKLDVRFTIGVKRESVDRAATQVFGDAWDEDARHDVVREIANLTAGGFKGAVAGEGVALTMGLPVDIGRDTAKRKNLGSKSFVLHDAAKTMEIGIVIDVLSSPLQTVKVCDLREGMVLANDVLNASGGMLVPAGRLTQLRIARVVRALPPKTELEVAHASNSATG